MLESNYTTSKQTDVFVCDYTQRPFFDLSSSFLLQSLNSVHFPWWSRSIQSYKRYDYEVLVWTFNRLAQDGVFCHVPSLFVKKYHSNQQEYQLMRLPRIYKITIVICATAVELFIHLASNLPHAYMHKCTYM